MHSLICSLVEREFEFILSKSALSKIGVYSQALMFLSYTCDHWHNFVEESAGDDSRILSPGDAIIITLLHHFLPNAPPLIMLHLNLAY